MKSMKPLPLSSLIFDIFHHLYIGCVKKYQNHAARKRRRKQESKPRALKGAVGTLGGAKGALKRLR